MEKPPQLSYVVATLIAFQVLLIFVHLAVYGTLDAAFGAGSPALATAFAALTVSFLATSLLIHWFSNRAIALAYAAASYWFGLILFLFGGSVVFFFAARILYSFNYYVPPAYLGAPAFAAFFLVHLYGTWKSGSTRVTRVQITLPDLPAAWRGKRIVFVSDPHLGAIRGAAFMRKIVQRIQALAPEAVMIGGDLYDGVACDAEALIAPLAELKPPRGVYYVTGNHEYYGDAEAFLAAIGKLGTVRILNNEKVDLAGIELMGVDDQTTRRRPEFEKILAGLRAGGQRSPSILLRHQPDELAAAEDAGISLTLSGHTHRGQIFPLQYLTRQMYQGFDYGLKRFGRMQVLTSSGAGTWGPPLRLGTKSEIVLIELIEKAISKNS